MNQWQGSRPKEAAVLTGALFGVFLPPSPRFFARFSPPSPVSVPFPLSSYGSVFQCQVLRSGLRISGGKVFQKQKSLHPR